jgi:LacI family transcriptional regulator
MTIGVIVPEVVHHFFSRVISGVENRASQCGYHLVISLSKDEFKNERRITEMLTNGYVDGLLVSVAKETLQHNDFGHFTELINRKFPIVFFDRIPPGLQVDKVIVNDLEGGFKATEHLIEKQCKNIAVLTTPTHITVGAEREKGYLKALRLYRLPVDENLIIRIDERQSVSKQIEKLFQGDKFPDGIFAVNENYAAQALRIARKTGFQIPDDIAIIGFTDGIISKFTEPPLSTIAQHGFEMGEKAMEILLERIQNKNTFDVQKVSIIETNLIERESTKRKTDKNTFLLPEIL